MKKLFLSFLFCFSIAFKVTACSCSSHYPFCRSIDQMQNDLIVRGVVTSFDATDTLSMRLRILQIYKGQEAQDTITIWSGTGDVMCGPMNVNNMGHESGSSSVLIPGDTIITILPRITQANMNNSWEIPGDYKRPAWLCYYTTLLVKNDSVKGRISGSVFSGAPYWSVNSMTFSEFQNSWTGESLACHNQVGIAGELKINQNPILFPNPASGKFTVKLPANAAFFGTGSLTLTNVTGRKLKELPFNGSPEQMLVQELSQGTYLVFVTDGNGQIWQQKLIIQQ